MAYKADDTRLNRFVALGSLTNDLAHDSDSIKRFRREAEAASALDHSNICTVYDIGEQDGHAFLAMEFSESQMLKDYIAGNSLALPQGLKLGAQITAWMPCITHLGLVRASAIAKDPAKRKRHIRLS